jgi:PAS domain S-box-containing protein
MNETSRGRLVAYGVAVLATGLSVLLRLVVFGFAGTRAPFITFFPAIIVSAYIGGLRPGLLATLLGAAVANYFLIEPLHSFEIHDAADLYALALFMLTGVALSVLGESWLRSQRKRAEETARRSESELRDLIENVPAMVFIALPGPANAFASRRWREYTGLSQEETAGSGWQTVTHPEDLERHMEKWGVCSPTGEPFEDEARFRRATDGEYRWFLVRAVPLRDEMGNILRWYGVLTDIEDRKRTEEALRESERRYRNIFETAGVSLWEEDFSHVKAAIDDFKARGVRDFRQYLAEHPEFVQQATSTVKILDVNQATVRLFGATSKDQLLVSPHALFTPQTQEVFAGELLAIAEGQNSFESEAMLQTLQGEKLTVLLTVALPPQPARFDRVLVSVMDITGRRAKEEADALRRANERMERAVRGSNVGVWEIEMPDGDFRHVPSHYVNLWEQLGYEGTPHGKETLEGEMHPDDVAPVKEAVRAYLAGEITEYEREVRFRHRDNSYRTMLARGAAVRDAAGKPLRFLGIVIDITKLKVAEEALRQSK